MREGAIEKFLTQPLNAHNKLVSSESPDMTMGRLPFHSPKTLKSNKILGHLLQIFNTCNAGMLESVVWHEGLKSYDCMVGKMSVFLAGLVARTVTAVLQSFLYGDCLERRQPVKGKPLRGGIMNCLNFQNSFMPLLLEQSAPVPIAYWLYYYDVQSD